MDLNDLWQGNRRFILAVGGGFVLFLIAKGVIGSVYDVPAAQAQQLRGRLARTPAPDTTAVRVLEAETAALDERIAALEARMRYEPLPRYVLPRDERSPDLFYNAARSAAEEDLVQLTARSNLRVDPSLGLPDLFPNGREEIQRYLRGLSVVERVVEKSLLARVRALEDIDIKVEPQGRGRRRAPGDGYVEPLLVKFRAVGTSAALTELLRLVVAGDDAYLAVQEARMRLDPRQPNGFPELEMTLAALAIDPEVSALGARP